MSDKGRAAMGNGNSPFIRVFSQLALFGFRGVSTVAKFVLTLYIARYLGLADLGVYGLVAAAGTLSPAILGFGLTDWVARRIVLLDESDALRQISARLCTALAVYLLAQPILWAANFALGSPVPSAWIWFIVPIVLLEHLASDAHDLLIARGRIALTSTLQFVRAGVWPVAVVVLGLLFPAARTLDNVFFGWLLGLLLMWAALVGWLLMQRAGPLLRWAELVEQAGNARASFPLYVRNVTGAASLFIDRYLISLTLGLELTGVYVFFWSVANVVHGMIVSVIVQPQAANLIEAVAKGGMTSFRERERKLRVEAASWTLLMSLAAFGTVIVILPFLGRPALDANFPIFGLILLGTWARVAADESGFVWVALHRDKTILVASAVAAVSSAALNLILVPAFGLWGAASAFLLTGLAAVALRLLTNPVGLVAPAKGH